jgi:serine phosphatase RsbU (regulator of sigma subunit)
MQPAEEVGGDYYDFIETHHGETWLAVGDVSGHGVESGLVMMMAQTSIFALVNEAPGQAPSEIFVRTNRVLRENISRLGSGRYMTLNVVRLGLDQLSIAGKHQDVFVWRASTNAVEVLSNQGTWLGVVDDVRGAVDDFHLPVGPGDWVLFYTDVVTEARNAAGEMYGEERLRQRFERVAGRLALERALDALLADVRGFMAEQTDDLTLVLLKRRS